MVMKHFTQRIAQLEAVRDHQEILYLLNCHVFPCDIERALEFAQHRRIVCQEAQVTKPASAYDQHRHQRKRHAIRPVVAIELPHREHLLELLKEARSLHELPNDLQTAVGGQLLRREPNGRQTLDIRSQSTSTNSH